MFLPTNRLQEPFDFVMVTADAYVDHPSFGHAVIARLVESQGFSVGILAQPVSDKDFLRLGTPGIAFLVAGGVVDSMVNNYTVAGNKRKRDEYSEGGKFGKRPDRVLSVYCNKLRELYGDTCIIIGGIEASLRRLSHYDYWSDSVRPSILVETNADLVVYGLGEKPMLDLLSYAKRNVPLAKLKSIPGTAYITDKAKVIDNSVRLPSHDEVVADKKAYAKAYNIANEHILSGTSALTQDVGTGRMVVVNPPQAMLSAKELDMVAALPYERASHPMYRKGVPALAEVEHSIIAHRGCYGGCSFCALCYHQGKNIETRSLDSIMREAEQIVSSPTFKGYIHDIGGPSANFHTAPCKTPCKDKQCIGHRPCPNLRVDHSEYLSKLRAVAGIDGVKKVFVRSGIRYDYLMMDDPKVLRELVVNHISGQLKVAPEHCSKNVLKVMNKPDFEVYKKFVVAYRDANDKAGLRQFLVPYLMSSHPGCTLRDAYELTQYLKSIGHSPQQVQDFYPTPGTLSTAMYYLEFDPRDDTPIYVAKAKDDKAMQRALLQWLAPGNKFLVAKALRLLGVDNGTNQGRYKKKAEYHPKHRPKKPR